MCKEPLISFEVETRDNPSVFSNTSKFFETSSKVVTKPWGHFIVIYKTKLRNGLEESSTRMMISKYVKA